MSARSIKQVYCILAYRLDLLVLQSCVFMQMTIFTVRDVHADLGGEFLDLFVLVLLLVGATSSKSLNSVVPNRIRVKFDWIVPEVNTNRLTESDF